jgi:hypothetical protein
MPMLASIKRFFLGLALVLAILVVSVALLLPIIHHWGATDAEVAAPLPGDELLSAPLVIWTHAINIKAPPEQVWPWVAQMGDDRGGFYSYTFIENLFVGQDLYHNADRILPEFQHPAPGEGLIFDMLKVRSLEPNGYLLADMPDFWTWVWQLTPQPDGTTRLVVRVRIQPPPEASSSLIGLPIDLGGFVMENKMLQGLKARAEGRIEPAWMQPAEIVIWLTAFIVGLAAAYLFVTRQPWQRPLALGLAAVLTLLVLTFVQPTLWLRLLLDAALLAGLWWAARLPTPHSLLPGEHRPLPHTPMSQA